jgi:hypothetical protein
MRSYRQVRRLLVAFCLCALNVLVAFPQEKAAGSTAEVHVVITDLAVQSDSELPRLREGEVKVKQGKTFLQVTQLVPAQGDNAALQLMILIDDTLNPVVGGNLNDLKEFIKAQPPSTVIGIGYMSNAGVNVVQNFTPDHDLAVKAVRLPRGLLSTMDSPYLSLISLVKGWTQQTVRREVLMVSDGIDRLRGETPAPSRLGPNFGTVYHSMPTLSTDATSASEISQRYNVIVHSLYAAGVGRAGRSSWDLQMGMLFAWHFQSCQLQTLFGTASTDSRQSVLPRVSRDPEEKRGSATRECFDGNFQFRDRRT